ncbi:MAG TPA: phage protein Gp27 family protein [Sumerlaeia bacterium]|nr:phage protein Gp27 family protein [Sumerlaeia bacterium]
MARRATSKISRLPREVREAVNDLLSKGVRIEEVTAFLTEKGVEIGKSSVGRYSKDFAAAMARIRTAREQAKTIVEELRDRPATEQQEAANQLATQMIFDRLLGAKEDLAEADVKDLIFAVAALEKSAVMRERAKLQFRKAADEAAKRASAEIGKIGKAKGIDEATIREIQAKAFGIVREAGK